MAKITYAILLAIGLVASVRVVFTEPATSIAEPITVEWSEIGKSVAIVGVTEVRVFEPTLYEVEWDKADVSHTDYHSDKREVYGVRVLRAGETPLIPPVSLSSKKYDVVYPGADFIDFTGVRARLWGQENGSVDVPSDVFKSLRPDDLRLGAQLSVSLASRLYIIDSADENESQQDARPSPVASKVFQWSDIGKSCLIKGQLGYPLGRVCRVKGSWDPMDNFGPFQVSEVDGRAVSDVKWGYYGVNDCKLENSHIHLWGHKDEPNHGETWILEGYEYGVFYGDCELYPDRGGMTLGPGKGFHTGFKWWKREVVEQSL